jgi:serine/threonine protein kinase
MVPANDMLASFGPRFRIEAVLGKGGFGSVYAARDQLTQTRVALKQLLDVDPLALMRFKKEFRALTDLYHPNLVKMHELFSLGTDWYFTMDLVEGQDFRTWVRGVEAPEVMHGVQTATVVMKRAAGAGGTHAPPAAPERAPTRIDVARLRDAMAQLADGVQALHEAGMLHRDLKPSNVLVSHRGRVKILDFGLVDHLARGNQPRDGLVAGTPAYMAPEQGLGAPLGPAADWYSVGVMLYEALRGRPPWHGELADIFRARAAAPPVDPRAVCSGLPDDLCDLALALLHDDPSGRPGADAILRGLGARRRSRTTLPMPVDATAGQSPPGFVGRLGELATLSSALADSRTHARVVELRGASGMGKTTLVRAFLARARGRAVVLEGRCYERESVPYKACDGLIDALVTHLQQLPADSLARLLPRHTAAAARLFPVLGRLLPAGDAPAHAPDPHELRRRAFTALRELMARIAARQPLVLFIDDLQWGDVDSAQLLAEVLAPPESPRLLLVLASRPTSTPCPTLEAIRRRGGTVSRIDLGPLPAHDAHALAAQLLGGADHDVGVVVRESGCSPFYVHELTRALPDRQPGAQPPSLVELVAGRIARVPDDARRLLELAALAGGRISAATLGRAGGLVDAARDDAISLLHGARLVRADGTPGRQRVEPMHDRIREAAIAGLDAEALRDAHRRLAAAIANEASPDVEALALHLHAAGDDAGARAYAELAGDRAGEALAFGRAVAFYEQALTPGSPALLVKLADALAHAGRGPEAAARYLEAVPGLDDEDALDARRRAAEQLLRSGHIDHGLAVVKQVLAAVGLHFFERPILALGSLIAHRLQLRARGLEFTEQAEASVDPAELRAIDLCWSVGNGLGGVDLLHCADFQARHLLRALEAGEPYRIARALAWEAILSALEGKQGIARADELAEQAEELAARIGHPHAMGWAASATAVTAWCEARWRTASQLCEYATALFRERCSDIAWELGSLEMWFNLSSLFFLGELDELRRRAPASAAEAASRGDLYAETTVRTNALPLLHLVGGQPELARESSHAAMVRFGEAGWHLQSWSDLLVQVQSWLYQDEPAKAAAALDHAWPQLERSAQLRVQVVRLQAHYWRARTELALMPAPASDERARAVTRVARVVRRLEREGNPWGEAMAASLAAGLAHAEGQADTAAAFARAAQRYQACEMPLFAAAAALAAARVREDLVAAVEALAALRDAGAVEPERVAAWLVPQPPSATGKVLDPPSGDQDAR